MFGIIIWGIDSFFLLSPPGKQISQVTYKKKEFSMTDETQFYLLKLICLLTKWNVLKRTPFIVKFQTKKLQRPNFIIILEAH